jgi:hypothetical protein
MKSIEETLAEIEERIENIAEFRRDLLKHLACPNDGVDEDELLTTGAAMDTLIELKEWILEL